MARILSELLGMSQSELAAALRELERGHDREAIDVSVVGDIVSRSAQLHQKFGLDPTDTTAHEMYAVLRGRLADDNERVARLLGGTHQNAVSEMTPLILDYLRPRAAARQIWGLKAVTAKKLLHEHQPIETMRVLNVHSIDNFLKRYPIEEIMVVVRYLESSEWNSQLLERYSRLTVQDFESRPLEVLRLDKLAYIEPLAASYHRHHLVLHSKEMGIVAIAPTAELVIRGYTLRTLSLALHALNEVTAMSSYFKHTRLQRDYGSIIATALQRDTSGHLTLANLPVHWRDVHAHLSAQPEHAVVYDHMDESDWQWARANDEIANLSSTLAHWSRYSDAGKHGEEPVSYNIIDLSLDESNNASFDDRSLKYMRRELFSTLMSHYLHVPAIRHIALTRLNSHSI